MNGSGVEIIPPKLSSLGTMNQYFGNDTYVKWVSFTFINEKNPYPVSGDQKFSKSIHEIVPIINI